MSCEIVTSLDFLRELKRLSKRYRSIKQDVENLGKEIAANPTLGTDMGDGIRKVRMAITSKGKGKSGGARVITYNVVTQVRDDGRVLLVTIYDKSERDSITKREIAGILRSNGLINKE
ncbi:MAG: type II toxin-antitoxin system RelE/ParE family toxin [Bacteroidales bacterium]|nr:type II toxin-antitoxin system RelE/ParE family toxin [Bacteroidales bacterium]